MIIVPEENDVIHGKGYSVNKRPGNKRYRSLIVSLKADYDAAPKSLKGIYGNQIVNHIYNLSPPGRFLRKDKESESYFEVDKEVAVRKARQALRDTPKELNKPTTRRVASAPLAEQNRNDTFIPRPAAITSPSAIAMSPPPQASIVGSPEDTIRRLLEDNRRLRHQMDRMQKEMEEMVAFNRMLHPRQPQGADNRHDNIVSSSDDGANDESDDLDLDNIDLSFIANDDISIFGMDVEALVNENLSMSEPVLRSKGPSVANKSLIDTSDHNEEVEIKGRGLHKSTDGPFSKFVNAFKKLSCRYSSRRDVAPDLVETENDILKIRIRTMQLMKKLMIQSHNTKLVNQESKAKETGAM